MGLINHDKLASTDQFHRIAENKTQIQLSATQPSWRATNKDGARRIRSQLALGFDVITSNEPGLLSRGQRQVWNGTF